MFFLLFLVKTFLFNFLRSSKSKGILVAMDAKITWKGWMNWNEFLRAERVKNLLIIIIIIIILLLLINIINYYYIIIIH